MRKPIFILLLFSAIMFIGACEQVETGEKSDNSINPITYRIYGYTDENGNEVKFNYSNCYQNTLPTGDIILKFSKAWENKNLADSDCYFEFTIYKFGESEITISSTVEDNYANIVITSSEIGVNFVLKTKNTSFPCISIPKE